jgi:hypothetical protein
MSITYLLVFIALLTVIGQVLTRLSKPKGI